MHWILRAGLLVAVGGLITSIAPAQSPDDDAPPAKPVKAAKDAKPMLDIEEHDSPETKYPDFNKLVKGAKVYDGLFTLHLKDDNLWAELRPDQLDKPYLLPIAVAKGAGMGGSTLNFGEEWVVLFKRVGEKIFLVRRNVRFTASAGSPAARAVETTYSDSVLLALPIKTMNPMKGTVVIDFNSIFFGDFAELGLGMLDRDRTTWHKVKAFKKNLELQVAATFSGGMSRFGGGFFGGASDEVIDPRGITVVIQYGLVELPESGYQPRYADNRVGHFLSAVKDFSKDNPDTSFVRMINRWRLERADGSTWKEGGKLVTPKKKIVFWIENSVPDEYREAVREGILEWNKAFEKVGFKNAIEVRQQEGEEFDPEDITYSTFRWTVTDSAGAIGPSRANPLTGEIIDADILFDASMVRAYQEEQRIFRNEKGERVHPASPMMAIQRGWDVPVNPLTLRGMPRNGSDKSPAGQVEPNVRTWQRWKAAQTGACQCAGHKRSELAFALYHLAAAIGTRDGNKLPDELVRQAVKEVTMHEVGHTLGLRHNFKASTMVPNDKLHDKELAEKHGLVGSVMDYSPANIAPKGTKQGYYFTPTLGPYDYWAIEYAYKPLSGGSDGEKEELAKIASKVADPKLTYGTDEDLFASPDPLVNAFDLGADPVQFGKDRITLSKQMIGDLADKAIDKGESYQRLRLAFSLMLAQYGDAAYLAGRQIGGVYVHRDHKGDPEGRDPLVPVPGAKQRDALKFLTGTILNESTFDVPPALLRKMGRERWLHWGSNEGMFSDVDFPYQERILGIQKIVLDELLDGTTLNRVQEASRSAADKEPLTVAEIFRALSDGIFTDLEGKQPIKSTVLSRNLQRDYVGRLASLVLAKRNNAMSGMIFVFGPSSSSRDIPADARSLARLHLKEIVAKLDKAPADKDDTVRAHREELKERITKVLAAQISAD